MIQMVTAEDDHHGHHHHDDAIKAFVFQSNRAFDPAKLEDYMGTSHSGLRARHASV